MRAFIRDNAILIENFELRSERPVFDALIEEFKSNNDIKIKREIMGPSENIVSAEYNNGEIFLCYDVDYGLCPIRCTESNIKQVFEIVNKVINNQ
ncbi:MAG: hypothetical protein MRZ66_00260 [Clostridiales bacterium]|nr:hypothetical protein [Clostridiales bacterium]